MYANYEIDSSCNLCAFCSSHGFMLRGCYHGVVGAIKHLGCQQNHAYKWNSNHNFYLVIVNIAWLNYADSGCRDIVFHVWVYCHGKYVFVVTNDYGNVENACVTSCTKFKVPVIFL